MPYKNKEDQRRYYLEHRNEILKRTRIWGKEYRRLNPKRKVKKPCNKCGKTFEAGKGNRRYCNKCLIHICEVCGGEFRSERINQRFCSQSCNGKVNAIKNLIPQNGIKQTKERIGKRIRRGKDHYNWQGGITSENVSFRNSIEYKEWRNSVFERDGFTCQICGATDVHLHVHHLKPFADYPKLRLDSENGQTVCLICHGKIHGKEFKKR